MLLMARRILLPLLCLLAAAPVSGAQRIEAGSGVSRPSSHLSSSVETRLNYSAPNLWAARDTHPTARRGSYAAAGAVVGALIGGVAVASICSREDCYVPVIPIVVGVSVGALGGALVGVFIDKP